MKNIIVTILRTGFTKSKKPLKDFTEYLFILKYILKVNEFGFITCNNNAFWNIENKNKRIELINDILGIHRKGVRDISYFHILNRFTNGDKYGIEVTE